ncbi:MAG: flavin reductase [Alphaproteobacteria bacterium]|jgi:flavin reductase (DIM6/NTAB) family NADH-FMN oxidoreductase RutF|nr:flavin reductase [Alphaproteobacteria bacterium]|tara:strand:+ start:379 stop:888 length:510 start_codon:yes stop_codon:yes gene_type:complete
MGTDGTGAANADIDIGTFWGAVGQRAVAATIVTARGSAGPAGFLGLSATHICADPPTMLISIDVKTSALGAIRDSGHFAINYLPTGAEDVVDMFAGKTDVKGPARFETGRWGLLATGAPVFVGAVGVMDCRLEETLERHNTIIAIGRVVAIGSETSADPLVYFRGGYLG